ncbi:MAG: cytochrome c biogenesis protein ResB [Microbacteriaceae bacterium]
MSRPSDHFDSPQPHPGEISQPRLGLSGYARFFWRQLTSMRTAIFLLLLLAIAAVPGSLVPQRSSDPNGVTQYFRDNPKLAPVLDGFQAFDVYTSVWFSSIYLLLFISLIGCVIPRTWHHVQALISQPPKTPARLSRLAGFHTLEVPPRTLDGAGSAVTAASAIQAARRLLRKAGYRVRLFEGRTLSVSAERGYLRETGNLVFHIALLGMLLAIGIGGGFSYSGQRVVVVGQKFVNVLGDYDSFSPGRFVNPDTLQPFRIQVDKFTVRYEQQNLRALGLPIDYTVGVTTTLGHGQPQAGTIKVNHPLGIGGTNVYLLGNGYAPKITVRDPAGHIVFTDSVPFLPQDAQLTSLGVIKVPDGLAKQLGMIGFFYPSVSTLPSGALASSYPDLLRPELTLNVFAGNLGLDANKPVSVYSLNTDRMTQLTGGASGVQSLKLIPGQTVSLPGNLGTITFDNIDPHPTANDFSRSVARFVSLDINRDPSQAAMLFFAVALLAGLLTALFVPRRRVWVKATEHEDGRVSLEYAGLARGEDPGLERAVADIVERHRHQLGIKLTS